MKIAIMQPYVFPYIGYFQLINAVDMFVFYDDVNFIKSGWIHRNRINKNGMASYFSIPIVKQSSFLKINQTEINMSLYSKWKENFLKSIELNYKKAPYYDDIFSLLNSILEIEVKTISELAVVSVEKVCIYLGVKTGFKISSKDFFKSKNLERSDRLISITKELNGNHYINLLGGKELYSKDYFLSKGVELSFIEGAIEAYPQFQSDFVPALSIIDVLMFNTKNDVKDYLNNYKLI